MTAYATYKDVYCNSNVEGAVPAYASTYADFYVKCNIEHRIRDSADSPSFDLSEEDFEDLCDWEKEEVECSPYFMYGREYDLGKFGKGVIHAELGEDCYGGPATFVMLMEDSTYRVFDCDSLTGALEEIWTKDPVDSDSENNDLYNGSYVVENKDGDFVAVAKGRKQFSFTREKDGWFSYYIKDADKWEVLNPFKDWLFAFSPSVYTKDGCEQEWAADEWKLELELKREGYVGFVRLTGSAHTAFLLTFG